MQNKLKSQQVIIPFNEKIDKLEKISLRVVIHTMDFVIIGDIYIRPRNRLIDELIGGDEFFAITDAEVYEKPNNTRLRTKFLVLNKEHIVMAIPFDEMERKP
jgi:hypothetical protein